jgi:hypothetical protein
MRFRVTPVATSDVIRACLLYLHFSLLHSDLPLITDHARVCRKSLPLLVFTSWSQFIVPIVSNPLRIAFIPFMHACLPNQLYALLTLLCPITAK